MFSGRCPVAGGLPRQAASPKRRVGGLAGTAASQRGGGSGHQEPHRKRRERPCHRPQTRAIASIFLIVSRLKSGEPKARRQTSLGQARLERRPRFTKKPTPSPNRGETTDVAIRRAKGPATSQPGASEARAPPQGSPKNRPQAPSGRNNLRPATGRSCRPEDRPLGRAGPLTHSSPLPLPIPSQPPPPQRRASPTA